MLDIRRRRATISPTASLKFFLASVSGMDQPAGGQGSRQQFTRSIFFISENYLYGGDSYYDGKVVQMVGRVAGFRYVDFAGAGSFQGAIR